MSTEQATTLTMQAIRRAAYNGKKATIDAIRANGHNELEGICDQFILDTLAIYG